MVFGQQYASIYDKLYNDQNWVSESKCVHELIVEFMSIPDGKPARPSVLDLGCGTGNHTRLLKNDYDMTGVDLSESMLVSAASKNPDVKFYQGDARTFKLDKKFDVVLMMSAVLGYQTTNDGVIETMKNVRGHLDDGGLFVFDVWYGPGVLLGKPTPRIKEFVEDGIHLLRKVDPVLDVLRNCCTCNYRWWVYQGDKVQTAAESHRVRYFFPEEIRLFFSLCGFKLLRVGQPGHSFRNCGRPQIGTQCTWHGQSDARSNSTGSYLIWSVLSSKEEGQVPYGWQPSLYQNLRQTTPL
jgi:SAM-dependent methyltransferase